MVSFKMKLFESINCFFCKTLFQTDRIIFIWKSLILANFIICWNLVNPQPSLKNWESAFENIFKFNDKALFFKKYDCNYGCENDVSDNNDKNAVDLAQRL